MANFLDIKTTDTAYARVMGLWVHYKKVLTLPFLEYRYEDLVEDFHHTTKRIVDFIGLGGLKTSSVTGNKRLTDLFLRRVTRM